MSVLSTIMKAVEHMQRMDDPQQAMFAVYQMAMIMLGFAIKRHNNGMGGGLF